MSDTPHALAAGSAIATCQQIIFTDGKPRWEDYEIPVRVMCVCEGYAMVRRKGCAPFILDAKRVRNTGKQTQHEGI